MRLLYKANQPPVQTAILHAKNTQPGHASNCSLQRALDLACGSRVYPFKHGPDVGQHRPRVDNWLFCLPRGRVFSLTAEMGT